MSQQNLILKGVETLLIAGMAPYGVIPSKRKASEKWDVDSLPQQYVEGGRSRQIGAVSGLYVIREYQVFSPIIYAGNYKFMKDQNVIPDIGDVIRRMMLVSTIQGTTVWESRVEESEEYEGPALEVGYEMTLVEVWYKTTEPRQ